MLAHDGRLLIVDFAPHGLEFLREQFAHERLGFADSQLIQWLAEAGLMLLERRSLSPAGDAAISKLTVSVWLAGRGQSGASQGAHQLQKLEEVS